MIYKIRTYADLKAALNELNTRELLSPVMFVQDNLEDPTIHKVSSVKTDTSTSNLGVIILSSINELVDRK